MHRSPCAARIHLQAVRPSCILHSEQELFSQEIMNQENHNLAAADEDHFSSSSSSDTDTGLSSPSIWWSDSTGYNSSSDDAQSYSTSYSKDDEEDESSLIDPGIDRRSSCLLPKIFGYSARSYCQSSMRNSDSCQTSASNVDFSASASRGSSSSLQPQEIQEKVNDSEAPLAFFINYAYKRRNLSTRYTFMRATQATKLRVYSIKQG